ncbi:hypothetical protein BH10CYA1_BH10CYA1_17770 [soil metagenome]
MNLATYLASFASGGGDQSPRAMLILLLALDQQQFESLCAEFNTHFKAAHKNYVEAIASEKGELWSKFAALCLPKRVLKVAQQTRGLTGQVETSQ